MTTLLTRDDLGGRPVEPGQVVLLKLADTPSCRQLGVAGQRRPVRIVDGGPDLAAVILTHKGEPLAASIPMDGAGFVQHDGRWCMP